MHTADLQSISVTKRQINVTILLFSLSSWELLWNSHFIFLFFFFYPFFLSSDRNNLILFFNIDLYWVQFYHLYFYLCFADSKGSTRILSKTLLCKKSGWKRLNLFVHLFIYFVVYIYRTLWNTSCSLYLYLVKYIFLTVIVE